MMQPNHGGSGGQQMNTSQLSIQELQRLQQEMQARLRQQQQSTSQGAGMMQQQQQQQQQKQQQQRLMGQQMGNQQQVQRNSLSGVDNATFLLLQQQQQLTSGARRSITGGGMSEPISTQAALYMNAMQSNNIAERQNSLGSQSSGSSMGRFAGGTNQNPNQLLPSRNGGGPSLQAQAMFLMQQQQQQQQQMGSSSMLMGCGTNPQLAAATTSEQLLIQQQRMMADIKRQLQNQHQLGVSHHRRTSSSSLGSQRQATFPIQQQQSQLSQQMGNSLSSSHGGSVQDYGGISSVPNSGSGMNPPERTSSISHVEPISLASLLDGEQDRRGSTGSQTSMGRMYGGSTTLKQEQAKALQQQQHHLLSALLPATPEHDPLQSQHQVSSIQQLMVSSEPQLPSPDDRIRRETSNDSGVTVKRGNRGEASDNSVPPKLFASTQHSSDTWNSSSGQAYMEGTFEGGWQSNADLPERREVIFSIAKLLEQNRSESETASKRLPQVAKRIEEHLYRTAKSKEEYLDALTLKKRLQSVAKDLQLSRSPSDGQPTKSASQVQSIQSDARLSAAERQIMVSRQQLQQIQQLQKLQQPGISDRQTSLSQMQLSSSQSLQGDHSLVASVPPGGHTRDGSQLNAAHTGILKSTSKYQDPALDRKRKVIKQQQQRLLLLRHASKCKAGASCKTKYCGQMVALWKHMKKCRDKNCKTSHCLSSRCVLNHYRMCKSENRTMTCEVCAPVMHQIKMLKSSDGSKNAPKNDSLSSSIVRGVSGEFNSTGSMDSISIRKLEEIGSTQSKLREQQTLLKELKQQQALILEQQNQIRQQQQRTQPQSEEEVQLEQQQGLLQQLNHVFEQQQSLLQGEVKGQSHLKTSDLSTLPADTFAESPMESSRVSENLKPKLPRQSNPSGRRLSTRGRGSQGKILSAMEPVQNLWDSPTSSRKRSFVDHATAKSEASGDVPKAKAARVEVSVPRRKVLHQGDSAHTTSLIQSMPIDAIERHLASLNNKMSITPQTISQRCLPIVRKLIDDQFGWVFRDPVDPVALGLPDYLDIVKNPMNLYQVEAKLLKNKYQDIDSFSRDTRLVFNNAILYNGEDSEVGEMAAIMLHHFDKDIKSVLKDIDHGQRSLKHGDDSCILCGSYRRLFEPMTLYCNGACGMQRIRRNASYFTDHTKQNHWCASCYVGLQNDEPILLEDGSQIRKSDLQKLKHDSLPEEAWVQCDECNGWCHQICALFNGRKNKNAAEYRCPKCHILKEREAGSMGLEQEVKVAQDLPRCKMSTAIESGLHKALASAYEERALDLGVDVSEVDKADSLFVRVVSNLEKNHVVRDEMYNRYAKRDGSASDFPVRSKCIALFQTIDGVDVILFAMYVYEYGDSCPTPNRRRVYISYLDSVYYFEPKCYRTTAYHALIIEYLRYVKERGFHTAHIWSCPPSNGDDYVFYSHPKEQLVPREDMLRQWYHRMLEKAKDEGIVLEVLTLYDEYFANNGKDALSGLACNPTCLPYFEGDYIPGEIENIIKEIGDEEQLADISGEVATTAQDAVMVTLGGAMYNMRENFMVVRLRSKVFIAAVGKGEDVTDWIDIEGQAGEFSTKRIKIGSKDSSCLTQLPAETKRIMVEKIEDIAVKSFVEGQGVAIDGTKMSGVADVAITTRKDPSNEVKSSRPFSEQGKVNLDVISRAGISGVTDGRPAKDESNMSTTTGTGEQNIESASAAAISSSENINGANGEEWKQSKEESWASSKRNFEEIEPSLPKQVKPVGSTNDEDGPQETEMFESRQQFLNYCQANHLQFDELRRAKHSTMMILFQLHNPSAPMFLQQCGACYRDITHGTRYHCRECSSFDLCQDCYEPVTTGLWAKRDSRFTHNFRHTFVAIDMEAPDELEKGSEARSRTIKLHLELLSHAATCGGPPTCSLNNCRRMKKLFAHVESCEVTYRKGCKICSRLLSLLTLHARMCTVRGSCPLPFCDRIRERNKRRQQQQRLMDDRRRQAQNDLYRRE